MSDVAAQASAFESLDGMPGITVDARSCERGDFLIVECADDTEAMKVYELVVMADPNAELAHSATTPNEIEAVKERMGSPAEIALASTNDLLDA